MSDAGKYREAIEAFSGAMSGTLKTQQPITSGETFIAASTTIGKGSRDVKIAAQLGDKQAQDLFKSLATRWTSYLEVRKATHSYLIPKEIDVVCRIRELLEGFIEVGLCEQGRERYCGSPSLTHLSRGYFPCFPKISKSISRVNERELGSAWVYFLDRRTGSLNIGNVLSGQCSSAGEHQF